VVLFVNPEFGNITIRTGLSPTGRSTINMTAIHFHDMTLFKSLMTCSIPKDKNDQNYENVLIRSSINVCKMLQGVTGDFITRMLMHGIKNNVDFDMKCPFKKVRKN
jgi:hypothetical protein